MLVKDVMSKDLAPRTDDEVAHDRDAPAVKPDDDLESCARLMCETQVHRIQVVDEKGALVGFVALADLAEELRAAFDDDAEKEREAA